MNHFLALHLLLILASVFANFLHLCFPLLFFFFFFNSLSFFPGEVHAREVPSTRTRTAEAGMQHCQMYIGILLNGFLFTYLFICIFLGLRSAATLSFSLQL